jgi:D-tagatose-1,6-bisphosphate aldolase subunit GatZ/KbaZ
MDAITGFKERLLANKKGNIAGIYSVCSAHPLVLKAAMRQTGKDNSVLLIESTSNQVDQYGGYTRMVPADFVRYVLDIAGKEKFPAENIIFGGDHLGPNVWQNETAVQAMEKAKILLKSYTEAGYQKIHLDASMFCADDKGDRNKALPDEVTAGRAAELCKASEAAWRPEIGKNKPLYVIGTEVPVPGGARENEDIKPSSRESVLKTIETTREKFRKAGLDEAWDRVIAVVAQPGVEFGNNQVSYYDSAKAQDLSRALDGEPLVFEAHSTDYQTAKGLKEMVRDHFAILKVGPWLTFACREALFSLAAIENLLVHKDRRSNLEDTLEAVMLGSLPNYWEKHYTGSEEEKALARKYSFSDRSRYYWNDRYVSKAVNTLFGNLSEKPVPLSLISQFMPDLFMQVSEGEIKNSPEDLVIARVQKVLAFYAAACGFQQSRAAAPDDQ